MRPSLRPIVRVKLRWIVGSDGRCVVSLIIKDRGATIIAWAIVRTSIAGVCAGVVSVAVVIVVSVVVVPIVVAPIVGVIIVVVIVVVKIVAIVVVVGILVVLLYSNLGHLNGWGLDWRIFDIKEFSNVQN